LSDVFSTRSFAKSWLPVLVWMAVIFAASSDTASALRSSRIIEPILRWLFPDMSAHDLKLWVLIGRKIAHLTEYAILALLLWRALRKPVKGDPRSWSWKEAQMSLLLVVAYSASDEFHQMFVPTREASVRDVFIDMCGGILGLLLLRTAGGKFKWWRTGQPGKPDEVVS
jgi:VanZ family protein